jgi:hypothetical protein
MDELAAAEQLWKQGNHDGAWLALEELESCAQGEWQAILEPSFGVTLDLRSGSMRHGER